MGYVMYVDSSQFEPDRRQSAPQRQDRHHARTERTPLGRTAAWIADKTLNTVLDSVLRNFLFGEWYVRLAGAVLTGVLAGSVVWFGSGLLKLAFPGLSAPAVVLVAAAVAGAAMGAAGGLLTGAAAAWLLPVIAEGVGAELSKDPLALHFPGWLVFCLSLLVGGLASWVVARAVEAAETRWPATRGPLRGLGRLLFFAATALVLIRTGASAAGWNRCADVAAATGPVPLLLAVGIGLGVLGATAAGLYLFWLVPRSGVFCRVRLPVAQAVTMAMVWTLAVLDDGEGSTVTMAVLVSLAVWVVPWAVAVLAGILRDPYQLRRLTG